MDEINIKGLKVLTCHGVLPFEKNKPQPFIFDVKMSVDFFAAAKDDDLNKTVNYAAVCELIKKVAKENVYNLIETLAYECAFAIIENYAEVQGVVVTVGKPQAPIEMPFETVSVTCELKRERVILSLGSSIGDSEKLLKDSIKQLGEVRGISVKKVSSFIRTKPYGGVAKNEFLNCAVEVECVLSPEKLLEAIHDIEKAGGRVRDKRWDDRTIDIDIIFFGSRIIREEGLSVPHPDYANRDFVLLPIKEIAPYFVCPDNGKRIADL
jgi:dihydroneopterin aldolase/2-amino-4-hydroxy-6-hydroxymethyldihydropteridine diphosphokinase